MTDAIKDALLAKLRERGEAPKLGYDQVIEESESWLSEALGETPSSKGPSMRDVLGPSGVIAQSLKGYEAREQQLAMAELVASSIKQGRHCIVEAGCGVGKSLAYLVPAIYSGKKTIVSTGDKSLQDQLFRKDLPFLQSVLPITFKAAILKGRANYLCLERFDEEHGEQSLIGSSYEFSRLQKWLENTTSGDLEDLDITLSPELTAKVTCTNDACPGKHCPQYEDCYATRARAYAEDADIIIVNHWLLSLDAAIRAKTDGKATILPDRDLVIVDEAHNLSEAATMAFQTELGPSAIGRLLHDKKAKLVKFDQGLVAEAEDATQAFFQNIASLSRYNSYRVEKPSKHLLIQAENLSLKLSGIADDLHREARNVEESQQELFKKHIERVRVYAEAVGGILKPQDGEITYAEKRVTAKGTYIYLRKCPIGVGAHLREALFDQWPVVCTSATLATGGNFQFFKASVGCDEAKELILDSPFDFKSNALVYLPMKGVVLDPRNTSPDYFESLASEIERLLLASDGRAFCLFTSFKALNEVYGRIAHRLKWTVLKQGEKPRPELMRIFKEDIHAVLFGSRSFFEGADAVGETLSLVIVDKLPFTNPDDPVQSARVDDIKARGGNWFAELALPSAAITLKQGFGRLIRSKSDCGVVALLDSRLVSERYGSTLLNSLPKATQTRSLEAVKTFFQTNKGPKQAGMF